MGRIYAFRVQATDNVSNTSAFSAVAVAKTVVVKKYYSIAGQRVAMRANAVSGVCQAESCRTQLSAVY
jgi:hypothetical protein